MWIEGAVSTSWGSVRNSQLNKKYATRTEILRRSLTLTPRVSRYGYHPIKRGRSLNDSQRCRSLSLGEPRSRFRPSSAFGELKSSVNLGHLVGLGLGDLGVVRCASDAATSAPTNFV